MSHYEVERDIAETRADNFWNEFNRFNPLTGVMLGFLRIVGEPVEWYKCTKCSGFTDAGGPRSYEHLRHGLWIDGEWRHLEDLKNNSTFLEKARK